MLTLRFKKKTKKVDLLEERLKEMSLGFQLKQKKGITGIELRDGDQRIKGYPAINAYLDDIQGELKKWWYCDC